MSIRSRFYIYFGLSYFQSHLTMFAARAHTHMRSTAQPLKVVESEQTFWPRESSRDFIRSANAQRQCPMFTTISQCARTIAYVLVTRSWGILFHLYLERASVVYSRLTACRMQRSDCEFQFIMMPTAAPTFPNHILLNNVKTL